MIPKTLIAFLLLNISAVVMAQPYVYQVAAEPQQIEVIYKQAHSKLQRFLNKKHSASEAISLLEEIIAEYNQLREETQDKYWMNLMATDIRSLLSELQNKGIQLYQDGMSASDKLKRQEDLNLAYQYLHMASQLSGPGYMLEQVRGQIAQALGDAPVALQHYQRSLSFYQKKPPTVPDPDLAYNYYRISFLQEIHQKKPLTEVFQTVQSGLDFLQTLSKSVERNQNTALLQRYVAVQDILQRRQLDLYLRMPERSSEALLAYEKALKVYPKDYIIHIGYGNLLEQAKQSDVAAAIYKQAITLNTDNYLAKLSLGRLYYNRGAELLKQANQSEDLKKATLLEAQAKAFYLDATPYLEAALIQKDNREMVLQVLLQISAYLNDVQAYKKYKQHLLELRSQGTSS